MPYVDIIASTEITSQQEMSLKASFGGIISVIPGKSEKSLMLRMQDKQRMWFAGDSSEPSAFVNVMLYKNADREYCKAFSEKAIEIIEEELGIKKGFIYVKFDETLNFFWG